MSARRRIVISDYLFLDIQHAANAMRISVYKLKKIWKELSNGKEWPNKEITLINKQIVELYHQEGEPERDSEAMKVLLKKRKNILKINGMDYVAEI